MDMNQELIAFLLMFMMSGEPGDVVIEGHTIHRVLAADWLLSFKLYRRLYEITPS